MFAIINHGGSLQSGHYNADVKYGDCWFHVEDDRRAQRVSKRCMASKDAISLLYMKRNLFPDFTHQIELINSPSLRGSTLQSDSYGNSSSTQTAEVFQFSSSTKFVKITSSKWQVEKDRVDASEILLSPVNFINFGDDSPEEAQQVRHYVTDPQNPEMMQNEQTLEETLEPFVRKQLEKPEYHGHLISPYLEFSVGLLNSLISANVVSLTSPSGNFSSNSNNSPSNSNNSSSNSNNSSSNSTITPC